MRIQTSHLLGIFGFLFVLGISIGLIFGIGFETRPETRPEPTNFPSLQPTPRPGEWKQLGNDIDGEAEGDESGESVSLSSDGTIVAIGASKNNDNGSRSGHVRVYEYKSASGWLQLGDDIDGESGVRLADRNYSGRSLSLSADGTKVAIGAPYNNKNEDVYDSGHVRVYEYDTSLNDWIQLGDDIDGERNWDHTGYAVSLSSDGTIVTIGAKHNLLDETSKQVRVYEYDSSSVTGWVQLGTDINAEAVATAGLIITTVYDAVSLSADGLTVAIGAQWNDDNGKDSGHVRVYEYDLSSDDWIQHGDDIIGEAQSDRSGYSVSLSSDGTIVAIGAPQNSDNGFRSGHVRVYEYKSASGWLQLGDDIDGEAINDESGHAVSLSADGTVVAIGAPGNDDNGFWSGHVRVYEYDSSSLSWKQLGDDFDGEAEQDESGSAVSLSADGMTVAIGAHENDGNGEGSGHVRVYAYHSS